MTATKNLRVRIVVTTWLLACLVSAIGGVETGLACSSIPGLGTLVEAWEYGDCDAEICYVVDCDASFCGEGYNEGQHCAFIGGEDCQAKCAVSSESSARRPSAPAGRLGCRTSESELTKGGAR